MTVANNEVNDDKGVPGHYFQDETGKEVRIQAGGTGTVGQGNFNFGFNARPVNNAAQPAPVDDRPAFTEVINVSGGNYEEQAEAPNRRRENPLSNFSSVTYNFGLYAITPDSYNSFLQQGKWVTKDLELICKSGGVTAGIDSPRNPYFDLDLYIDNVEIITKTNGKESRMASNVSNIRFNIYEPYAMSFPSKLVAAQKALQAKANIKKKITDQASAIRSPYLLVIRFYGYDANGNLVTQDPRESPNINYKTDTNATYERAFPIIISKFSFKLEHKTTVYDIEAKLLNEQFGFSITRGVFKNPTSTVGDSVGSALGGTNQYTNGLLDKLNAQQKALVSEGKQSVADVYKIIYEEGSGIDDALIVDKDFYTKELTGQYVTKAEEVNERTAARQTATVPKNQRTVQISAGTSILTAIDQVISQSTYLRDKMKVFAIDDYQLPQSNDNDSQKVGSQKQFIWYYVRPQIKFLNFDEKRKDYAMEITYIIQSYKTPYLRSLVIKDRTQYYGPHKVYEYWYTGKNTEVLSYDTNFNLLYFNTQAQGSSEATTEGDDAPNAVMPATDSNPSGKTSMKNELQNTVRTTLYSPSDLLKANIKILGDPDFLMPVDSATAGQIVSKYYGPDGYSINANSGQVFIEIGFNEVIDYNNNTGLLEPKNNIRFWNYPANIEEMTQGRMIYMVTQVTSKFARGTFTQDLKSVIPSFLTNTKGKGTTATSSSDAGSGDGRETATSQQSGTSGNLQNAGDVFRNAQQGLFGTGSVDNAAPEDCEPLQSDQVQAFTNRTPGQLTLVDEFITVNDDSLSL